jgi:hypothetical protein
MKRNEKKAIKEYLKNAKQYHLYRDELSAEIITQKAAILTQLIYDGLVIPTEYAYLLQCLRDELAEIVEEHKIISN